MSTEIVVEMVSTAVAIQADVSSTDENTESSDSNEQVFDSYGHINKYKQVMQSNKYADSNTEATGIKLLLDSAEALENKFNKLDLNCFESLITEEVDLTGEVIVNPEQEETMKEHLPKFGHSGPARSHHFRKLANQQLTLVDDVNHDGYLPGVRIEVDRNKFTDFRLPGYDVPRRTYQAIIRNDIELLELPQNLCSTNYIEYFQKLLWVEEAHQSTEMRRYDLYKVLLSKFDSDKYLLVVPNLAEGRPSLMRNDRLLLRNSMLTSFYEGFIHDVRDKDIIVKLNRGLPDHYIEGIKFDVSFEASRLTYRRCHHAIRKFIYTNYYLSQLFPDPKFMEYNHKTPKFELEEDTRYINNQLNNFQKKAVKNILKNVFRPMPYILFGPPGTGKTVTLIEAILQVYKRNPRALILACGNSNTSADVLAEKLMLSKVVPPEHLVRITAYYRTLNQLLIPRCIRDITKVFDDIVDDWYQYRIVITTCVNAATLWSLGDNRIFDFVFIDEAGHAQEPEAMIALDFMKKDAGVVISGDPFQLGPVIMSRTAKDCGLGTSILERLYHQLIDEKEAYPSFDDRFITKLRISYRSDPRVMVVNNKMFYHNELSFKDKTPEKWLNVLKTSFPLVFKSVKGRECREYASPSWFNPQELMECFIYICQLYKAGLKPEQLGFITPYRQQLSKMMNLLRSSRKPECKIGTVEEFQGLERHVIIISTVRTKRDKIDAKFNLGFLSEEKRFNVAVSRAKWLVIVVGDPELLETDPCWGKYIKTCKENNSFIDFKRK